MKILDHDNVEPTNMNRQLFFPRDMGLKKGVQLAKNLVPHSTCGTVLEGFGWSFQDALALKMDLRADFAVVGVDNGQTRVEASRYFRRLGVPTIFVAVDLLAEGGYVFVQEPGKACFGCLFPKSMYGRKAPCRTPASLDVLQVVSGFALYAIDSLLMRRKRNWNYREIHLAGFMPSHELMVARLPDCSLCGTCRPE